MSWGLQDVSVNERIIYVKAKVDQFYVAPRDPIIYRIERVPAGHHGFTGEELDFGINYEIKYRMGQKG